MAQRATFPSNFVWGAATASYQIEGGHTDGGKGQSIWDRFSHTPGKIVNGDTGDVACDHYHRYADDVALMSRMGLRSYRFSIAWPRIFPEGKGKFNRAGIEFYQRLVDRLLEHRILPFATLYHWDLPQALQEKGGWANRDVAHYFRDYAAAVYEALGDRVHHWITHNEPWVTAVLGYTTGVHAPGLADPRQGVAAAHNLLLSHGEAVLAMRDISAKGLHVGITLNLSPAYPASDSDQDVAAARKADAYQNRWFLDPVFKGRYPEDLLEMFGELTTGIVADDLPVISVPIDFLGVNYYSRQIVRHDPAAPNGIGRVREPSSEYTAMDWEVYPDGLYTLLTRLERDYGPELYITENGAAYEDILTPDNKVHDDRRIAYLRGHLNACHRAIRDGAKLRGYFVWSLLDNFEWAFGYTRRFGVAYVDYQDQRRILKDSARWYREAISENGPELEEQA